MIRNTPDDARFEPSQCKIWNFWPNDPDIGWMCQLKEGHDGMHQDYMYRQWSLILQTAE